jgi:predicted RNase H-like HicB family nuclease
VTEYAVNIFCSDAGGGWIADISDLEVCSVFRKSAAEALGEMRIAKAAWLESGGASGKPTPAARFRVLTDLSFS